MKIFNTPPFYAEALSQLDTLSSLETEVKRKRIERSDRREALRVAQQRYFEANSAANGYSNREVNKGLFLQAKEEAHQAQGEINAQEAEVQRLGVELDAMQQAIDGTQIPVTAEVVVYHQSKIGDLNTKLEAMRSRRDEILASLNATPAPDPIASLLMRENILAAAAMGEPVEAELQRIDAAIEEAEPIRAKAESTERADRQALAGLNRRIAEVEAELTQLRDIEGRLIGHLIVLSMQETAGRYEVEAASAADLLLQLQAFEAIRSRVAPRVPSGMNLEGLRQLHLPAPGGQPVIDYRLLMAELNNAVGVITGDLKSAGISIQ